MLEVSLMFKSQIIEGLGSHVELASCNGGYAIGKSFTRNGELMFEIEMMFGNYIDASTAFDKKTQIIREHFDKNGV